MPLQDANPTPSFGGFGLKRTFILNSDTYYRTHHTSDILAIKGRPVPYRQRLWVN